MDQLTAPELDFLIQRVNDRIIEADKDGVSREHSSSKFREELLNKLLAMREAGEKGDVKR